MKKRSFFRLIPAAAVLLFSAAACTMDNLQEWLGHGDDYLPIIIPQIEWLGDTAELGGMIGNPLSNIRTNVVTTTTKDNGSYVYKLETEPRNFSYNILQIESVAGAPRGAGNEALGHDNFSANEPGILFMWDRNHVERDAGPDVVSSDVYHRGILKVHQNVFQKYPSFLLRIRFIEGDYKEYLIRPQSGQLKNLRGDSYIFLIREATGAFNNTASNYISNVFFEEYVERETPVTPPPPPVYTIVYTAVDEQNGDIGAANGIFTGTDGADPVTLFTRGDPAIQFRVTTPPNYTLASVRAGNQALTPSGNFYSYTPQGDTTVTASFTYNPPPPVVYTVSYTAVDGNGERISGVFSGTGGGAPPASVESPNRAQFKVTAPPQDNEVYIYELVDVKVGETVLRERNGMYAFRPQGNVTVTALFNKTLPPVDDYEEYQPTEADDPYGTATFVTPAEKIDNKVVIISVASEFGAEVDPDNKWLFSGKPIKTYYDETIKKKNAATFNEMTAIRNSQGQRATYIWDRSDSWVYGISGSFTVITASRFDIDLDEQIVENNVWFYFACDNAAAVYVNGRLAGYTTVAFDKADAYNKKNKSKKVADRPGPTSDWRFTGLDNSDFSGDDLSWENLYRVDIKPLLMQGHNEILIMAANNDSSGGRWNDTNNPAGLIFACQFTVR